MRCSCKTWASWAELPIVPTTTLLPILKHVCTQAHKPTTAQPTLAGITLKNSKPPSPEYNAVFMSSKRLTPASATMVFPLTVIFFRFSEKITAPLYPLSEQNFALPSQNAYSNVNINYAKPANTQANLGTTDIKPQGLGAKTVDNQINIAQILKDFRNTAKAIGTPDDLNSIVDGYLEVVEKQVRTNNADKKLIKNTLNSVF